MSHQQHLRVEGARKRANKRELEILRALRQFRPGELELLREKVKTQNQAGRELRLVLENEPLMKAVDRVFDRIEEITPKSMILVRHYGNTELKPWACRNIDPDLWLHVMRNGPNLLYYEVFVQGYALEIEDIRTDSKAAMMPMFRSFGLRGFLGTPLMDAGTGVGVLSILSREPRRYTATEMTGILSLSKRMAGLMGSWGQG